MNKICSWLLDLLFPPKCVFCHKLLRKDETEICNHCRMALPIYEGELPVGPYISQGAAALFYEDHVRQSILRYKFSGLQHYADCYGVLLSAVVRAKLGAEKFDMITWVPVSRKRLRKRGFDQSERLASALAAHLGLPLVPLLRKIRDNPPQSTIVDESRRRANVLGAYQAINEQQMIGKCVLLVDDILTTNATISETARMLLTAGAAEVYCAVFAAKRTSIQ